MNHGYLGLLGVIRVRVRLRIRIRISFDMNNQLGFRVRFLCNIAHLWVNYLNFSQMMCFVVLNRMG